MKKRVTKLVEERIKWKHICFLTYILIHILTALFTQSCTGNRNIVPDELKYGRFPTGTYFTIDHPYEGQLLHRGKMYPSPQGRHNLPVDAMVWIVLVDQGGSYYIQRPTVKLNPDSTWIGENVILGSGMKRIMAVSVTVEGNETFREKSVKGMRITYKTLPEGSIILASIRIMVA